MRATDRPTRAIVVLLVIGMMATAFVALSTTDSFASGKRPVVGPIVADFIEAARATEYSVVADDPEGDRLTITWNLVPPAGDPNCNKFTKPPTGPHDSPLTSTAVWHHADTDGCSHAGTDHPGLITVEISDGTNTCTAGITGSNDHQGGPSTCPPPGSSPSPTPTGAATATAVTLCHGDPTSGCNTVEATNEPADEHELCVRVVDKLGNPVANVPVEFRETGPGIFTPHGGSRATVTTDANGIACALLTSDVEGTSTIVAEISPQGTAGSIRGPGATDDECEREGGNCISQTLVKNWEEPTATDLDCGDGVDNDSDGMTDTADSGCSGGSRDPSEAFQCNDGLDNDGDGSSDFGEDPGCVDANDDDEAPPNDVPPIRHDRSISIRFNDGTGARNNGLIVFGRLGASDLPSCGSGQPVNVQRRVNGRWVTKKTTNTNRRGRYAVEIFDLASRYRAVAPQTEMTDESTGRVDICRRAIRERRHRHRR